MKKFIVCAFAAMAVLFASCGKDYAEQYVGTYDAELTQEVNVLGQTQSVSDNGPVQIVATGDNGEVDILFLEEGSNEAVMTMKGIADKEGLHVQKFEMTENDDEMSMSMSFAEALGTFDGDVLSWKSDMTGTMTITEIGQSFDFSGALTIKAKKVK